MDDLENKNEVLTEEQQQNTSDSSSFLKLLTPVKNYYATPLIILTNALLFLAMVVTGVDAISPEAKDLISWGANFRPMTVNGEFWRLLTSCFLHIGVIHLILNMYALISIGPLLESLVGSVRFLFFYILAGIAGSATSFYWHESTVSAGASGAIFGMYGLMLALVIGKIAGEVNYKSMLASILIFIGYNLLFGMQGDVDNAAHLGGLASGFLFGLIYCLIVKKELSSKWIIGLQAALMCLVFAYCALVYLSLPSDMSNYYNSMKEISEIETKALEVYSFPQSTAKEVYISEVKKGLLLWEKTEQIAGNVYGMDVPEKYLKKNDLLKEYLAYRKKSYQLILRALEENSDAYNQQLEVLNGKVAETSNKLEDFK